ncbi:TPA: hypothetical protein O4F33_005203 [Pseudomonas aeruginosa]|nr:hypothetical protein [Pseudomonas aeruginosa]
MNEATAAYSPIDGLWWPIAFCFGAIVLLVVAVAVIRGDGGILRAFVGATMFAAIVGCVLFLFMMYQQEKDDWRNFAAEHCKVIEKRDAQNATGFGLSLNGTVGTFFGTTSSQTGYQCDDGVTYWKNN